MSAVEVAAGLIVHERKLLLTQRYPNAHLGGLWEFPGGKRELNETFEECLRRELLEEVGIEVVVEELVETVHWQYPERAVLLKFFRCSWLAHEPQPLGCHALAWVTQAQLDAFSFPAADLPLVERLRTEPKLWRASSTPASRKTLGLSS
jgi:8-oxo-dGTP diphosphatase